MRAKLEFNLDDHSDRLAHKRSINATDAYIALSDINNKLRDYVKYSKGIGPGDTWNLPEGSHELTENEACLMWHLASEISREIGLIIYNNGINMDDLE